MVGPLRSYRELSYEQKINGSLEGLNRAYPQISDGMKDRKNWDFRAGKSPRFDRLIDRSPRKNLLQCLWATCGMQQAGTRTSAFYCCNTPPSPSSSPAAASLSSHRRSPYTVHGGFKRCLHSSIGVQNTREQPLDEMMLKKRVSR